MVAVGVMLASPVLNLVVKEIGTVIGGQIKLQKDFTKDLKKMKMMLESVAAVMEDAERQSIEEREVQLWLKRLKDAMYGISDMLDEFEEDTQSAERKISLKMDLLQLASGCLSICPKIKLANRMKEMREELKVITDQHTSFMLRPGTITNELKITNTRATSSVMKDEELLVGRTNDKRDIMASLSEGNTRRITIFPIYGIGGIGKTTLAKMVFNDVQFKDYSHVWVYVSQTFDLNKIGNSIISQLLKEESQLTERQMIHNSLVELLAGKNILIVLDDLWEDNGSHLDDLKDMLKVGEHSRIVVIVTTRNEGVANKFQTIKPYKLAPLSNDSCWTIIKQKSSFDSRDDKHEVEQIGKDIAVMCRGVALAAQSLGYMLKELTSDQWESVRKSNIWNVSALEYTDSVLSSLRLTYSYMPSHLKLCFAYCAIFPKGHKMVKDDLIHQWNSLGFIEETDIFSTEQLGEKYISQLLGLSFLEHSRLHNSATGVHHEDFTHLTMHDLVLDLARLVLVDEFIMGVNEQSNSDRRSCRYALCNDCSKKLESHTDYPTKIRALRFLDCGRIELHKDAFSSAKYLRVLDLSECIIQRLPDSIGQLKQLRYLNAPRVQHHMIPNCITKLFKLTYLSLCGSSALMALPDSIGHMESLMHLNLSGCSGLEELPESFGKLKQLVHLDLSNCSNLTVVLESLRTLTNLEYLDLSYSWNIRELSGHLGSFMKLKHLSLSGCGEIEDFSRSFGNLKSLMHLDLSHCDQVKGLPEALGSLTKLQYLNLSHCGCIGGNEMAEALGNLTTLWHLYLSGFLDTTCDDESTISTFLECISTLSNLEHLDLSCNKLYHIPECFGSLSKLCTLNLSSCSGSVPENINLSSCSGSVPENMVQMDSLKVVYAKNCYLTVPYFELHLGDTNGCGLSLFQSAKVFDVKICGFEKVKSVEEVKRVELFGKKELKHLTLEWVSCHRVVEDEEVLDCLLPSFFIQSLNINGYGSLRLPSWLMSPMLPLLVSISLEDLANCISLPPLGKLPCLKTLVLKGMDSIAKIDEEFCGAAVAFRCLENFSLRCMPNLEVWNTTYSYFGYGESRYMFPCLLTLDIESCPKLRLEPCPPKANEWTIWRSDGALSSSWGESASYTSASTSSSPLVTTLKIHDSELPMHQWRLLCHLPALCNLYVSHCSDLTSSPEIILALSSLQSLSVHRGHQSQLPEWLGHLTDIQKLCIGNCEGIESLPESIQQLTKLEILEISECPALERWCESEENKMKLSHIKEMKIASD